MPDNIAQIIAKQIINSNKTVVLTGAGISTESGIPDFRSPGGLWTRFDVDIMSSHKLYSNPSAFYKKGLKMLEFLLSINKAEPNPAHSILARMEKEGLIEAVITQNIDSLHIKAGSKKVYEVHGNLREAYCMSCGQKFDFKILVKKISGAQIPPECNRCGGTIRPSIVLFGDELPPSFIEAAKEAEESDLLLVIGSSLEVAPVNNLPRRCKKFIIINREKTYFDSMAHGVWHENASKALDMIYSEIKK